MKLPVFFAKRYLFSKKSVNAVNIISAISVIGVFVSTAALVIVLSIFNGIENFILSKYSVFAPELRIEPSTGKVFESHDERFDAIRNRPEIKSYTDVLEDKVLVQYGNRQFVGRIKGVEPQSLHTQITEDLLLAGHYTVEEDSVDYLIMGAWTQANLKVPFQSMDNAVTLFIPKKDINPQTSSLNPMDEINTRHIQVSGVLKYEQGFDDLVITSLDFAKNLLGERDRVSAVEIDLIDSNMAPKVQNAIQSKLGDDYIVKDREQQNPSLYMMVRSEKWIIFFIVTIIGIIAIFNIIGSLTMLVIDKKKDMHVLKSLGAKDSLIQQIFFYEGVFIALFGSVVGVLLGYVFCVLQDRYGIIRTDGQSMFDAYPVDIRYSDFALIFFTVMLVSIIVSYVASKLSVKNIGSLELKEI